MSSIFFIGTASSTINRRTKYVSIRKKNEFIFIFFYFRNFEHLIKDFENKWNTCLSQLNTPKTTNVIPLTPVVNDLTNVCQQLNQQNVQMQQQLSTITNRIQNMQTKVNN
jgi:hypothetical protein